MNAIKSVCVISLAVMFFYGAAWADEPNDIPTAAESIIKLIDGGDLWPAQQGVEEFKGVYSEDPELPKYLTRIAERFGWARQYESAISLYKTVIENYPGTAVADESVFPLRRMEACLLINRVKNQESLEALEQLEKDFADREDIAEMVYWICKESEWTASQLEERKTRYELPIRMLREFADKYPDSEYAQKAIDDAEKLEYRTKLFILIEQGDDDGVNEVVAAMIADINDINNLGPELHWVAKEYELYGGGQERAKGFYLHVLKSLPGCAEAKHGLLDVMRMEIFDLIEAGKLEKAQLATDALMLKYKNDPYIHQCICRIGKMYCEMGEVAVTEERKAVGQEKTEYQQQQKLFYGEAQKLYRKMLEELPQSGEGTASAHWGLAVSSKYVGAYEEAIEHFRIVAVEYREFMYACNAACQVAWCYNNMVRDGIISKSEADPQIENAYLEAIELFKGTKYEQGPTSELAEFYDKNEQWDQAEQYYRRFLDIVDRSQAGDITIHYAEARLRYITQLKNAK